MMLMGEATKILVIDDEEAICFAFARYFGSRGAKVWTASTLREGLELLDAQRPDVVFLDVRLPDGNGLDLLERLRQAPGRPIVIVITAYGSLQAVTRAVRGKAYDLLAKPLDLDRAAELVETALAGRAIEGEPRDGLDSQAADLSADAATAESQAIERADSQAIERAESYGAGRAESQVAERDRSRAEGDKARARSRTKAAPAHEFIGTSAAMQEVYKRIGKVAQSDASVLILGATGTGKELVARTIHEQSTRAPRPFVAVNCGALPENLIESELFGYTRGAFTGADTDKIGRFEAADSGTLLLDEVGELPPPAQVKLLRFLDSRTIERLGSVKPIHLDVRILAATNRDLAAEVQRGRFRADLYYRLAVIQILLPTLSRRIEDVLPMARHFLSQLGGADAAITAAAAKLLTGYSWPGNVRELRNAMEHAMVISGGGAIGPAHLPETVRLGSPGAAGVGAGGYGAASEGPAGSAPFGVSPREARGQDDRDRDARESGIRRGGAGGDARGGEGSHRDSVAPAATPLQAYVDAVGAAGGPMYAAAVEPLERALILRALEKTRWNQSAAADLLGLHRNTLRKKIQELRLDDAQ